MFFNCTANITYNIIKPYGRRNATEIIIENISNFFRIINSNAILL